MTSDLKLPRNSFAAPYRFGRSLVLWARFTAARRRDAVRTTHPRGLGASPRHDPAGLSRRIGPLPPSALERDHKTLEVLADLYLRHRFDLLGSGWSEVRVGQPCRGLGGICFEPADVPSLPPDRVNAANRAGSAALWSGVSSDYVPIDWQLDFKSGFRWAETTWYRDIRYGDTRGADIKVPWELGRLQHLPQLALAALVAEASDDTKRAERLAQEIRNQILDFAAANPPRFGVQWRSTMDVAIRAVNLLVTWDLLKGCVSGGDHQFESVLASLVRAHGRHIADNLESSGFAANHYLADVVGLLFVAAYLPVDRQTTRWLEFAERQVISEVARQFGPDGGNFEGSLSYHRLSAEMATYGIALISGLHPPRVLPDGQARGAVMSWRLDWVQPWRPLWPPGG